MKNIKVLHIDPLINKVIGDDELGHDQFRVQQDHHMIALIDGIKYLFTIIEGYVNDGSSVPGLGTFIASLKHWQLDSNSTMKDQSDFHDRLYELNGDVPKDDPYLRIQRMDTLAPVEMKFTRAEVDYLMYDGLKWQQRQLLKDPDNVHGTRSMTEEEVEWVHKNLKKWGWTKWNKKVAKVIKGISRFIHSFRKR